MCCTEALTRILVFIANFAFLLVGGALLTVGILYKIHFVNYTEAIPEEYNSIQYIPTIAIVVGSTIFLIAFLGCCGTLRSNTCMLTTYAGILFVIFLIQVALGVFALLKIKDTGDLQTQIHKQIANVFPRYNTSASITEAIDIIQQKLECCGTDSPQSWISAGFSVPQSCYDDYDKNNTVFGQGCSDALFNFINSSVQIIAIVALAISLTEIVGAILALCLSNCIRANERRGTYY